MSIQYHQWWWSASLRCIDVEEVWARTDGWGTPFFDDIVFVVLPELVFSLKDLCDIRCIIKLTTLIVALCLWYWMTQIRCKQYPSHFFGTIVVQNRTQAGWKLKPIIYSFRCTEAIWCIIKPMNWSSLVAPLTVWDANNILITGCTYSEKPPGLVGIWTLAYLFPCLLNEQLYQIGYSGSNCRSPKTISIVWWYAIPSALSFLWIRPDASNCFLCEKSATVLEVWKSYCPPLE